MQLQERGYAKINLTLDVLGKRTDGYHDLVSIMQTVDLYDTLTFSSLDRGIELTSDCSLLPNDERNLAYKAALLLLQRTGFAGGVRIELKKRIPLMAGLAGGSTDAAAVLRGLNRLWNLGLKYEELWEAACELGSDVPFCLNGGTCLAEGRGEILTPLKLKQPVWLLLLKPEIAVSTKNVYQALDLKKIQKRPKQEIMQQALAKGDVSLIALNLVNVLESVTLAAYPELKGYKEELRALGSNGVLMSGSGPTIFALAESREQAEGWKKQIHSRMESIIVTRMIPGEEGKEWREN